MHHTATLGTTTKISVVHAELRDEILSGRWQSGDKLPGDLELATRFGCSPGTINKAMTSLMHEGFVERKARAGTRVLRTSMSHRTPATALDAYAFICPNDLHEGIRRLTHGFQDAASEAKRRTIVLTTGLDLQKETEIISSLSEFDVKGAAVFPVLLGPKERVQFTQTILKCSFPIVLAQTLIPDLGRHSVHVDGLHAGFVMTEYLINSGSKNIGFLSNNAWALLIREKYSGYRQAMFTAGLDKECERYAFLQLEMQPNFDDPISESRHLAKQYLESNPSLDAVVCADDFVALGVLEAAAELGIKIPGQLRIVGINDFSGSASASVPITTYRVPYEELGRVAFSTLDQAINGLLPNPKEIQVRGNLIVRKSA